MTTATDVLDAAKGYAERGWRVLRLHSVDAQGKCNCGKPDCPHPGKHPKTEHGLSDATCDVATIERWFGNGREYNVGIATGPTSGFFVLDEDPRDGGNHTLEALEAEIDFPVTVTVSTGGGGTHQYFRWPDGDAVRSKAGVLGPGLDVKGAGGYVVAPPSRHASGREYEWELSTGPDDTALAPAPPKLLERLRAQRKAATPTGDDAEPVIAKDRNATMTLMAGQMRHIGMGVSAIKAALYEVRDNQCAAGDHPVADREIDGIAGQAATWEAGDPRLLNPDWVLADWQADEWPEPRPLPVEPVLPELSVELLPGTLRRWLLDIADRLQVPLEFPAAAAMVALGAVVGRRYGIYPKRRDDWLTVPNIWGCLVGPPGVLKSQAAAEPFAPLRAIDEEWWESYRDELTTHQFHKFIADAKRKALGNRIGKASGDAGQPTGLRSQFDETQCAPPKPKRLVVNDATTEKLGEILAVNPAGIVVYRDELAGWLRSFEKLGRETDRAFYLEAWNGTSSFTTDRISRGTVRIESACVSVFGTVQPGVLDRYVQEAVTGSGGADGLIQRFQLLVAPATCGDWQNVDRQPDSTSRDAAHAVFRRLSRLSAGADDIPALRFDAGGQALFDDWRAEQEPRWRDDGVHPALTGHLSKYRSLMPSIALLIELAGAEAGIPDAVTVESATAAVGWCRVLEAHARKVYGLGRHPDIQAADALLRRIRAGDLGDSFTARDVYRKCWSGLATREAAIAAIAVLVDHRWLRLQPDKKAAGGRPTVKVLVNPRGRQ